MPPHSPQHAALSVKALAKSLSVSKDKVLGWIHAGELHAIDVRSSGSSRAVYRIPGDAVQAFSTARSNSRLPNGPETESKRDSPRRNPPKIEYF
jgi:excisionase family DNA binding protein